MEELLPAAGLGLREQWGAGWGGGQGWLGYASLVGISTDQLREKGVGRATDASQVTGRSRDVPGSTLAACVGLDAAGVSRPGRQR